MPTSTSDGGVAPPHPAWMFVTVALLPVPTSASAALTSAAWSPLSFGSAVPVNCMQTTKLTYVGDVGLAVGLGVGGAGKDMMNAGHSG